MVTIGFKASFLVTYLVEGMGEFLPGLELPLEDGLLPSGI